MKSKLAILFVASLSCGSLAHADEAKPSAVTVPESAVVPVGGTGYLTIKVDRKLLPKQVQITLQNLPDSLVIVGGESVRTLQNESDSGVTFVLQASPSAAVDLPRKIDVVVASADTPIIKSVNVRVVQFAMRPLSWLVMSLSVASVLVLMTFCVWRVMTLPPVEQDTIAGPLEIDTRDTQNAD